VAKTLVYSPGAVFHTRIYPQTSLYETLGINVQPYLLVLSPHTFPLSSNVRETCIHAEPGGNNHNTTESHIAAPEHLLQNELEKVRDVNLATNVMTG